MIMKHCNNIVTTLKYIFHNVVTSDLGVNIFTFALYLGTPYPSYAVELRWSSSTRHKVAGIKGCPDKHHRSAVQLSSEI